VALKSILYVEDDLHVRTSATLALEVIGQFAVRACGSGRAALIAAQDFHPDLIVLDVLMPELDGLATLAMLRRMPHLAAVPAVFVTGMTEPRDLARYAQAGALGVIPEPLVPLRLVGQINTLWRDGAATTAKRA